MEGIEKETRRGYVSTAAKFLMFLRETYPEVVNPLFGRCPETGIVTEGTIKLRLSQKPSEDDLPLVFEDVTIDHIMQFIMFQKEQRGRHFAASTYGAMRSSILNLFTEHRRTMSAGLASELKLHFKGLNKEANKAVERGELRPREGKEPMQFRLYRILCRELLHSHTSGGQCSFGHLFLTLSWNLMCRSHNNAGIRLAHMEWGSDHLRISFAHTNTSQDGNPKKFPRAVFANPLEPALCPILSLGVYLLVFPEVLKGDVLYPGSAQQERFGKLLEQFLSSNAAARAELEEIGLDAKDLGTHSPRKGAPSHVCGVSAAPSFVAVCHRCGWSMGKIKERNLRFDAAGDQHVGRVVCGLPDRDPEFAILPPYFDDDMDLTPALDVAYPYATGNMRRVVRFCLASVVYHRDYLVTSLSSDHALLQSTLFRTPELLSSLGRAVKCHLPRPMDIVTGVPPHISMLVRMDRLQKSMDGLPEVINASIVQLRNSVQEIVPATIRGIESILSENNVEGAPAAAVCALTGQLEEYSASVTSAMEDRFKSVLEDTGLLDLAQRAGAGMTVGERAQDDGPTESVVEEWQDFEWGGRKHPIPEDFTFPSVTPHVMWELWCCGDRRRGIRPYRFLISEDLPSKDAKKRLCDLRLLMDSIKQKCVERNLWSEWGPDVPPDVSLVRDMFTAVWPEFQAPIVGEKRCRRSVQITWRTEVNRERKRRKLQLEQSDE